jgi:tetratricopeptide (TPR) repeat protein
LSILHKHKLPRALYNRALSNLNLQKLNEASRDLNELAKLEPDNADAYLTLGVISSMKKDFKSSIPYYDKAIACKPDMATAYFNRGVSRGNLNLHREALTDYTRAIELHKNYAEAYFSRAVSEINLQQTEAACKDLNKARDLGFMAANELITIHCGNPATNSQ